ncbi:hypothetical protein OF83DRAFT_1159262 [Amylostereum chailletii]|nr:hypothetical protein OF83DRAFT_1159837 [Amylostereum chailletii]KAI0309129.1 hypothetical protein OF83DRAFT_1159262 [Amylostereum chailletii]
MILLLLRCRLTKMHLPPHTNFSFPKLLFRRNRTRHPGTRDTRQVSTIDPRKNVSSYVPTARPGPSTSPPQGRTRISPPPNRSSSFRCIARVPRPGTGPPSDQPIFTSRSRPSLRPAAAYDGFLIVPPSPSANTHKAVVIASASWPLPL